MDRYESRVEDILIKGAILELARGLALEGSQVSTGMTSARTLGSGGEGA